MKSMTLRSAIIAAVAGSAAILMVVLPAKAYDYYLWRGKTVDSTEKECAQTAHHAMKEAGFQKIRFGGVAVSGVKDGVTINVTCIKAEKGQIIAILLSIADDTNSALQRFAWMREILFDRGKVNQNP